MTSFNRHENQAFRNRQSILDIIKKNDPIKIKIMRSRDDNNENINEYSTSINPFSRRNSSHVSICSDRIFSFKTNYNKKKKENKDISCERINLKIIKNYHRIFMKEKNSKYSCEYIKNLVKLLKRKDKNYKLKRMLLAETNQEENKKLNLLGIDEEELNNKLLKSLDKIGDYTPIFETETEEIYQNSQHTKTKCSETSKNLPKMNIINIKSVKKEMEYEEKPKSIMNRKDLTVETQSNLHSMDCNNNDFIHKNTTYNIKETKKNLVVLKNKKFKSTSNNDEFMEKEKNKNLKIKLDDDISIFDKGFKLTKEKSFFENLKQNYKDLKNLEEEKQKASKMSRMTFFSQTEKEMQKILESTKEFTYSEQKKNPTKINFSFSTNFEDYKKKKIIEDLNSKEENENQSIIYKYFRVFEDKDKKSPLKLDQKIYIKKPYNREEELKKLKEHRLDLQFNRELDYSKILKENLDSIKLKFCKSTKIAGEEKKKFSTFYGRIKECSNNFSVFSEENISKNNINSNFNPNYKNLNAKAYDVEKSNFSNQIKFKMFNMNSPTKRNESDNIYDKTTYNSYQTLKFKSSRLKGLKSLTNKSINLKNEENDHIDNVSIDFNKVDKDFFIPNILKKTLYSSPRKDKYSFK